MFARLCWCVITSAVFLRIVGNPFCLNDRYDIVVINAEHSRAVQIPINGLLLPPVCSGNYNRPGGKLLFYDDAHCPVYLGISEIIQT